MTALAANRTGTYFQAVAPVTEHQVSMPLEAGTVMYRGALMGMVPGSGGLEPLADTAGMVFAGIALEYKDNTSGADGAIRGMIYTGPAIILLAMQAALAAGQEWQILYAMDDQTLDIAANRTNDVFVGRALNRVSDTSWWVFVNAGTMRAS